MNKELLKGLVEQINLELQSAYIYFGMASYLEESGFAGFSHWMKVQVKEEVSHAMRIYDFLQERGEHIEMLPFEKVDVDYDSVLDVWEKSLVHEKFITASIDKLANLAFDLKDFSAMGMLQWFVDEQVEEEDHFGGAVAQLQMAEGKGSTMLMLDREFGRREG
ncbi:MAG: ferritin [Tissierellia bacterium]|nr:ferritin [Tissierellia bacterium]